MEPDALAEHKERKELARDDHPGCLLSGFLLVNRCVSISYSAHITKLKSIHFFSPNCCFSRGSKQKSPRINYLLDVSGNVALHEIYFLFCFRVPGNFHIEARSKHHNLNSLLANMSHTVNHLSFGTHAPMISNFVILYVQFIYESSCISTWNCKRKSGVHFILNSYRLPSFSRSVLSSLFLLVNFLSLSSIQGPFCPRIPFITSMTCQRTSST